MMLNHLFPDGMVQDVLNRACGPMSHEPQTLRYETEKYLDAGPKSKMMYEVDTTPPPPIVLKQPDHWFNDHLIPKVEVLDLSGLAKTTPRGNFVPPSDEPLYVMPSKPARFPYFDLDPIPLSPRVQFRKPYQGDKELDWMPGKKVPWPSYADL